MFQQSTTKELTKKKHTTIPLDKITYLDKPNNNIVYSLFLKTTQTRNILLLKFISVSIIFGRQQKCLIEFIKNYGENFEYILSTNPYSIY